MGYIPFSLARVRVGVLLVLISVIGFPIRTVGASDEADRWIEALERYASQPGLDSDSPYSFDEKGVPAFRFESLLRSLPDPSDWVGLRSRLEERIDSAATEEESSRLRAGGWLMAYLLGDRETLLPELTAAIGGLGPDSMQVYELGRMRGSLIANDEAGDEQIAPEERLARFEAQLAELEPVDVEEVKRLIGGDENFHHLERLVEIGRSMQLRLEELYEKYDGADDESKLLAEWGEFQKEYVAEIETARRFLLPYEEEPWLTRYLTDRSREGMMLDYMSNLEVPDLVELVGEDRAKTLLYKAIGCGASLAIGQDVSEGTRRIIRDFFLAEMDRLKTPSWGLVQTVDDRALFEQLNAKFPGDAENYVYREEAGVYLGALILVGCSGEAVEFASRFSGENRLSIPYRLSDDLKSGGLVGLYWDFLRAWLEKFPAGDEWGLFNRLSAELGRQAELKALVEELAANGSFEGVALYRVQLMRAEMELATDDLEGASERLRDHLRAPASSGEERTERWTLVELLLSLSALRKDAEGFDAALAAAKADVDQGWIAEPKWAFDSAAGLVGILNSDGRFEAASELGRGLLERLARLKEREADQEEKNIYSDRLSDYSVRSLLAEQLRALAELGNWAEAGTLVHDNPWWGAADASGLLDRGVSSDGKPVGVYLARVAWHEGQPALARRILEALLVAAPGADSVYSEYLDIAGREARSLLERLAEHDRYEERPLIWLARLQLAEEELDAAVATLRRAIEVDPSDGEQGPGDRMRVYSFMSQAMAAKGEGEKAAFFSNVVKAIRLSETADEWHRIGAYSRAIGIYREALGFFQDAYCIQSRLAIRLASEGRMDEAAEHYQRAFELMPDSFGRVESHCFGCERAFAGERPQGVAEKVFAKMLLARPDKPQLHYLMGYLRSEQDRQREAWEHYQQAVALDPLYLNAWARLAGLERSMDVEPRELDDLLLKQLELDPGRRHVSPDLTRVSDLPRLWRELEKAEARLASLPAASELWKLKASAARLDQLPEPAFPQEPTRKDAAAILVQKEFVQAMQSYLAGLSDSSYEP